MQKLWQEIRFEEFLNHPVLTSLFVVSFLLLALYSRLPFLLGLIVAAVLVTTCVAFGICFGKGECWNKREETGEASGSEESAP